MGATEGGGRGGATEQGGQELYDGYRTEVERAIEELQTFYQLD